MVIVRFHSYEKMEAAQVVVEILVVVIVVDYSMVDPLEGTMGYMHYNSIGVVFLMHVAIVY